MQVLLFARLNINLPMSKLIVSFLAIILLSLAIPRSASAGYLDTVGQNPTEMYKQALEDEGTNLSQFGLTSLDYMIMGLTKKFIGYPQLEGEIVNSSLQSSLSNAVAYLYANHPSGVEYLAYSAQKLNLVKPTYAASEGLNFISPVIHIWTIARNTAYVFFIVIFVALGFMIMFRSRLNPQTVINVQLALPKIIIALVMVTFSFAISGFIVDAVFFGHALIKNIITEPGPDPCPALIFGDTSTQWEHDCATNRLTPSAWPFDILGKYGSGDAGGIVGQMLEGVGGILLGGISGGYFANPFEGMFKLVIAFSVVGATFKIFFSLLTKYIMVILLIITMPFAFLASALSSQSNPLKPLKSLFANVIAFPVTSLLLALAYYFASPSGPSVGALPPFYTDFFATGQNNPGAVTAKLVAIGILMTIPSILGGIDQALESKPIAQGAADQLSATARKIPIIGGLMG